VGGSVDFLQLVDRDLGVDRGRVEIVVAEDRLDEADVGTVLQHVGRHRVAEQVTGAGHFEAGALDVAFDEIT